MVLRPGSPHIHHPSPSPLNFMEVVTLAVVGPGVLVTWALSLSPPAAPPARAAPQPPALWPARPRTLRHLPPDPGCRPALTLVRLLGGPGDQTHLPGESRGRWLRGGVGGVMGGASAGAQARGEGPRAQGRVAQREPPRPTWHRDAQSDLLRATVPSQERSGGGRRRAGRRDTQRPAALGQCCAHGRVPARAAEDRFQKGLTLGWRP